MLIRNVQMNIRVTPEEKKLFEQAATRCGLTLSQYPDLFLHGLTDKGLNCFDSVRFRSKPYSSLALTVYLLWMINCDSGKNGGRTVSFVK